MPIPAKGDRVVITKVYRGDPHSLRTRLDCPGTITSPVDTAGQTFVRADSGPLFRVHVSQLVREEEYEADKEEDEADT